MLYISHCHTCEKLRRHMTWVSVTPRVEETDLYDDEILVKGRRWGGLSEFQDSTLCFLLGTKRTYMISDIIYRGWASVFDIDLYSACGLRVEYQRKADSHWLEATSQLTAKAKESEADFTIGLNFFRRLFICIYIYSAEQFT